MRLRLLLLRHGQIAANKDGRWHGSTDSPLTWKGRRQAKKTGRYLEKLFTADESIDAVYVSPLQRCQHTAKLATSWMQLPAITTLPGLQEMSIGEWEDMPFQQLHEQHNFVQQATGDRHYSAPGGESLEQVGQRVSAAFEQITNNHVDSGDNAETILVVSHGVALAVGLAVLLDKDPTQWTQYQFANCSLSELRWSPNPMLVSLNQTLHL